MCFYHWTSMFFSISPNEYNEALQDEIWGCFKYIGIPYDSLMNMPIQTRKYFIARHNKETEDINNKADGKTENYTGEATSEYTKMSMIDYKRLGPR